eukprot:8524446-Karenia_brevis.AAC.1
MDCILAGTMQANTIVSMVCWGTQAHMWTGSRRTMLKAGVLPMIVLYSQWSTQATVLLASKWVSIPGEVAKRVGYGQRALFRKMGGEGA